MPRKRRASRRWRAMCPNSWPSSGCKPVAVPELRVAYHAACSLQHGQSVAGGAEIVTRRGRLHRARNSRSAYLLRLGRHLQHAAAGDRPRRSATRKQKNIASTTPDAVATGNIGCITQIALGGDYPVLHTVELLDWATGGLLPAALVADGKIKESPEALSALSASVAAG